MPGFSYREVDEIGAYKAQRDRIEADEGALIDGAFRDILAGKFDTPTVLEALRLGHHPRHQELRRANEDAIYAARQAGVARG